MLINCHHVLARSRTRKGHAHIFKAKYPMERSAMLRIIHAMIASRTVAILAFLAACVYSTPVLAQVSPIAFVQPEWFNNSGQPCSGCLLGTFIAGTNTPQATWMDAGGTILNQNPVVLSAYGRASVFVGTGAYKFVLQTPGGVTIWVEDGIIGNNTSLLTLNNVWTGTQDFQGAVTFDNSATFNTGLTSLGPNVLGGGGSMSGTYSGSPIFSGMPNFSGGLSAASAILNGCLTFNGSISGSAAICVPSAAGTPNPLNLPTVTGLPGYILTTDGGTPQQLSWTNNGGGASLGCTNLTPNTISNDSTLEMLLSCTIPANALSAGSLLKIYVVGNTSTAAGHTMTITFAASLGGGTVCEDSVGTAAASLQPFDEIIDYAVVTSGSGGTATMACNYFSSASGGGVVGSFGSVGGTFSVDTTISNTLLITEQMSVANSGNQVTGYNLKAVIY